MDYLEEEVKESQKTPQQLLFQLADNMIVNEGKHVFLKILCDNLSEEEAKSLIDELISYGL